LVHGLDQAGVELLAGTAGRSVLQKVTNPILMNRLISVLPSSDPTMASIRRQLAYSYLTKTSSCTSLTLRDPSTWTTLVRLLKTDDAFLLNEQTEYSDIAARVAILDVAIGIGFTDRVFIAAPSFRDRESEVHAFNASVDTIVQLLRSMNSHIQDAGAAHLRRTECKTTIERLVVRLSFAVRTKPKAKKSVFGSITGKSTGSGMESLEGVMAKYLAKTKTEEIHVVGENESNGRVA